MTSVLDAVALPPGWKFIPFGRLVERSREVGRPDLAPLSVFLDEGVVPRAAREDNFNRLGSDMAKYLVVRPGDIVFNKLRTWQGGLGVSRHEGLVSPAYFVCRPSTLVEPRFLHYLLRSHLYLAELTRVSKFMPPSQFDILWDDLRVIPILTPRIETQRTIADYLDTGVARIDALIFKKQRLIELLEDRIDSIVFDGIRGRLTSVESPVKSSGIDWLGNVPQHFETPWLGAHHTTELGKMLNTNAAVGPEQYPYIKNTNVKWDHFDLEDLPTMSFDADDRRRCELRPGDVVVCEGGEVGRSAVWSRHDEIFFQKALHRVRPVTQNVPRFLMYCLWSAAKLNVFTVEGNQSTIVHLTGEKLREHRFPWPPLDEQDRIVSLIDAERGRVNEAVKRLEGQILLLSERRQALITSVVTGAVPVPGD